MKFISWISIYKYFKLGLIDYYRLMNKFWNYFINRMFFKGLKKEFVKMYLLIYILKMYIYCLC